MFYKFLNAAELSTLESSWKALDSLKYKRTMMLCKLVEMIAVNGFPLKAHIYLCASMLWENQIESTFYVRPYLAIRRPSL